MNMPILIESKSVFAPRGTATHTPKWSIVVLAVACLGVLKFNGPAAKTSVGSSLSLRETVAAAPRFAAVENISGRVPPMAHHAETNAIEAEIRAHLQDKNKARKN